MVAVGHKEEMAKGKAEKKNVADLSAGSGSDTDSDGSDVPELEENTGAGAAGASAIKDGGIAVGGFCDKKYFTAGEILLEM